MWSIFRSRVLVNDSWSNFCWLATRWLKLILDAVARRSPWRLHLIAHHSASDGRADTNDQKDSAWSHHAHLGVCLGQSPQHASSVDLILNVWSGCISPQFHCACDDHFETPQLEGETWVPIGRLLLVSKITSVISAILSLTHSMEIHFPSMHPSLHSFRNLPRILTNRRQRWK